MRETEKGERQRKERERKRREIEKEKNNNSRINSILLFHLGNFVLNG